MFDLFSFNYSDEITEKEIQEALKEVVAFFKSAGNPDRLSIRPEDIDFRNSYRYLQTPYLSYNTTSLLWKLEERGYIIVEGDYIELKEYRDWHTAEELAQLFRELADQCLSNGGGYYNLYDIRTNISISFDSKLCDKYEVLSQELDRYARKLGLKHFLENPKSRGHKMNRITKKQHGQLLKLIAKDVIPLKTVEEVEKYFDAHSFYVREYGRDRYLTFMPTTFHAQCLAEATDEDTVALIMAYIGGSECQKGDRIVVGDTVQYDDSLDLFDFEEEIEDIEDEKGDDSDEE